MNTKRVIGIVALVGAVALFGFSRYIKIQVGEGKEKIANAQKMLDKGDTILGLTPVTKDLGLTGGAKKKVANAKETVAYYENLADNLQIGGFVLLVVGASLLIFFRDKKKK